ARFEAALRLARFALPVAVEEVVVLGRGVVAMGGGKAFYVSAEGATREISGARFIASDGASAVIVDEQYQPRLIAQDLSPLELDWQVDAPPMSAAPALTAHALWTSHVDGTLRVHPRNGGKGTVVQVTDGPVSTPVVGTSGRFALVPTPGGRFCA